MVGMDEAGTAAPGKRQLELTDEPTGHISRRPPPTILPPRSWATSWWRGSQASLRAGRPQLPPRLRPRCGRHAVKHRGVDNDVARSGSASLPIPEAASSVSAPAAPSRSRRRSRRAWGPVNIVDEHSREELGGLVERRIKLLRAARILHRWGQALRQAEACAKGRDRRRCMGVAVLHEEPTVPEARYLDSQ